MVKDTETQPAAAHVFDFGPIYDGRCIHCDCRAYGVHAAEPCSVTS